MTKIIYLIIIKLYHTSIYIASFFNKKAKLWLKGRKNIFEYISQNLPKGKKIWFHTSSLGEFEQARPLIEKIKQKFTDNYKIILTFYSPSGYEVKKNYAYADLVCYLPAESPRNAKKFINLIEPEMAFFIKYDFWYFYLETLYKKNIRTYLVSGIFRENQIFFKKLGKPYSKVLTFFTHIFVQDETSKKLINNLNINNITITGDTRFDRVIEIAESPKDFKFIEKFTKDKFTVIAGSTWFEDEQLISRYINETNNDIKFIIAPHEVDEDHIINLMQIIKKPVIRYSRLFDINPDEFNVMIIDNIGMLSQIYYYSKLAYIGGGFGVGIHNIVEAAVYGMPVIFGPNYKKFKEAKDLIEKKAAFSIKNYEELKRLIDLFVKDEHFLQKTSNSAKAYVYVNKGATEKILKFIF